MLLSQEILILPWQKPQELLTAKVSFPDWLVIKQILNDVWAIWSIWWKNFISVKSSLIKKENFWRFFFSLLRKDYLKSCHHNFDTIYMLHKPNSAYFEINSDVSSELIMIKYRARQIWYLRAWIFVHIKWFCMHERARKITSS